MGLICRRSHSQSQRGRWIEKRAWRDVENNTTGRTEVGAGEETVGPCGIASPVNALISLIQVQVALPILEPSLLGVFDSTSRQLAGETAAFKQVAESVT